MPGEQKKEVILFADIVGSTSLYERLGNEEAKRICDRVLDHISDITEAHGGEVVKYIGDEMMARFPDPDEACTAAVEMQEATANERMGLGAKIKIGMDYGPVIDSGDDVFGNTVNVAARMASASKAGQIITTQDLLDVLSPENAEMGQVFDRAPVRGKAEPINLVTMVWEDDVTTIGDIDKMMQPEASPDEKLELTVGEDQYVVSPIGSFIIGRGMNCDLAMPQVNLASRQHAIIQFKRGKFVLEDQSTNGTYVRTADGNLVYLRREEMQLWGDGVICIGSEFEGDEHDHIYYSA